MFSGIIETLGTVVKIEKQQTNLHLCISSPFTSELKIDQSVAHNGVCLTVVEINNNVYKVTAIEETLQKTNLSTLQIGDIVNLERCLKLGDRLDGHIVQGHVDATAICNTIESKEGSWLYTFNYPPTHFELLVEKGSICINGVSLTLINVSQDTFAVAIIPYTYEHTNFKTLQKNTIVNLEFDIIGKYLLRNINKYLLK